MPGNLFNEIKYRFSLQNIDNILENFLKDSNYYLIDIISIKDTVTILKDRYLTTLKAISNYFRLQQSTVLMIIFLILKHATLCVIDESIYTLEFLLAYIMIAWKYNETTSLVVAHFI